MGTAYTGRYGMIFDQNIPTSISNGAGVFNLFRRNKSALQSSSPQVALDDDIPRYPPFAKGLPAAPTSRIMQSQEEWISRIRGTLRFNASEFSEIVLPVIERYAAYVHLLPASESHHHRGAGGLFRHGLEVGFWAAQRAESYQFCVGETPQHRRENEPRWQFASFLGGLLHDVGKPLSDVAVTDKTGKKEWNPYDSSLAEWSYRESIDYYFLRWRDKRNKRHEKFSMMNLDQIITPKAKTYLNKPGPYVMEALLEAIVGTSAAEALTQIVMWADQESVRRDLVNQRLDVDEYAYGVPVERFIFDALRRLVNISKINEPGALIWRLEQGVFLAWHHIVPDIHHLLEKDNIPGVPRNPDTLADILIERGFAIPYQENTETKPARYWRIYPEALNGISLNCLRLDDLALIFINEPPTPTKASFKAPPPVELPIESQVPTITPNIITPNIVTPTIKTISPSVSEMPPKEPHEVKISVEEKIQLTQKSESSLGWALIEKTIQRSALEQLPDGDFGIPYPDAARLLGEPREVMSCLFTEGLLRVDPASPSKTSVIAGKKYLILNRKVSRWVAEQVDGKKNINHSTKTCVLSEPIKSPQKEKSIDRKLPSQEAFGAAFIEQMLQGFGPFIAGDVTTEPKEGVVVYQVSIDSIGAMAKALNTTPTAIRTMVRKIPAVKIKLNHEKSDYIEYLQEA